MTPQRLSAAEVRERLDNLIDASKLVEPCLEKRLSNLRTWINSKIDKQLNQKSSVIGLLGEVILDSEFWLALKPLTPEQKQEVYDALNTSPAEKYWFDVLFPLWFDEPDPKLDSWKKELMAGNWCADDERLILAVTREIELLGGSCLWRHIIDLSMATDLLITALTGAALCVQITSLAPRHLPRKQSKWENTLKHWDIKRGLLISFNPMPSSDVANRIAKVAFRYGDSLPFGCYTQDSA